MFLRAVTVTIAPGQTGAYWAWAREILDLWDRHGVQRPGGPYRGTGPHGEDTALWLTLHPSRDDIENEFRTLYAGGRGKELIEQRPALVAGTTWAVYTPWDAPPDLANTEVPHA